MPLVSFLTILFVLTNQSIVLSICLLLRFDGQNFTRSQDSNFSHAITASTLASYKGKPFVTSGGYDGTRNTEIFSSVSQKWELTTPFDSM